MKALRLTRVSLTVSDLAVAERFYTEALGFTVQAPTTRANAALAGLLGAGPLHTMLLQRGKQTLELAAFDDPGAPYPQGSASNDPWFQHCALVTADIASAYAHLGAYRFKPISRNGPQTLPGGIVAFKFRDPDGHPLELIQFSEPNTATAQGIDHSAIAVMDAERSITFYKETLGLSVVSRQVNSGQAQDAMDDLDGTAVDVVALAPLQASPHVELLGYRQPQGRNGMRLRQNDVAASRLVFEVDEGGGRLLHDPDGHALLVAQ